MLYTPDTTSAGSDASLSSCSSTASSSSSHITFPSASSAPTSTRRTSLHASQPSSRNASPPKRISHRHSASLSGPPRSLARHFIPPNALIVDDTATLSRTATLPRTRTPSLQSLRSLAASWIPTASLSVRRGKDVAPPSTPEERDLHSLVSPGALDNSSPARPLKISRKRIDKAVSLAIEAAQIIEQEEAVRARKRATERERARFLAQASLEGLVGGRTTSLRSTRASSVQERVRITSSAEHRISTGDSVLPELLPAASQPVDLDMYVDDSSDESEVDEDPNLALDLYISSLSHLLQALPQASSDPSTCAADVSRARCVSTPVSDAAYSKARSALPLRQREELRLQLEEALANLGCDTDASDMHVHHHHYQFSPGTYTFPMQRAGQPPRSPIQTLDDSAAATSVGGRQGHGRSASRGVTGFLLDTGFDMTFAVGAGALALASRGLRVAAPAMASTAKDGVPQSAQASRANEADSRAVSQQLSPQWQIPVALASTAISALARTVRTTLAEAEAAEKRAERGERPAPPSRTPTTDTETRLVHLSFRLGAALKRSPLPSQAHALLLELRALLSALDERYAISSRASSAALSRTRGALSFVRRRNLHVVALRVAWTATEAALAAVQGFRQETEGVDSVEWPTQGVHDVKGIEGGAMTA